MKRTINLNYTLSQAAAEFYRHCEVKGLAEQTLKTYKGYVDNFIDWYGADNPIADVSEELLEEYMLYKKSCGNKPVSVATAIRHLRCFFRFCEKRGISEHIDIIIPKYEKELKEPYTDTEMSLLLIRPKGNNWIDYRCWAMVNYFFATGQRLSTVINIKVRDVDLINKCVFLAWNKDKIQKYLPLSTQICRILQEYIFISKLEQDDYLFPEVTGKQLRKRSCQDSIAEYNKSRGVDKTSIHLFRHTFAKNYIINGGNAVKLQKLLSHKSIETTMKYVNLYGNDISCDLDSLNPLDNFVRHIPQTNRRIKIEDTF